MRLLGNKVSARNLAVSAGVPVMPATAALPREPAACAPLVAQLGYPVMLKASWGGGGRGTRVVEEEARLAELLAAARREAQAAFGNDEVYAEKLVRRARHVEVQMLGDEHGTLVHLYERDCTVQRRNQKVVERCPAVFLDEAQRAALCEMALKIARAAHYKNAGTVEFLQDADTGSFYFIEVNPRIQVEHTVTECATGIDLVKAQIRIAGGARIGTAESGVPPQEQIRISAHALQCRITTEDPENNFIPDYGTITAYRSPAGFGVRLDAGTAYTGAIITRSYDSLLVKVTAWSPTPEETIARMHRALWEFRIRGVVTNLRFLDQLITHPHFAKGEYTTRFIEQTPGALPVAAQARPREPHPHLHRRPPSSTATPRPGTGRGRLPSKPVRLPPLRLPLPPAAAGTKQKLDELGAEKFAQWMLAEERVLLTDTSMRDAHQSLLATRLRTLDMTAIAPYYAALLPQLFSVECWGGATFDVAMRFLREDPWLRLTAAARADAEPAAADAAALGQRGRLRQLPGQRGAFLRQARRGLPASTCSASSTALNWVENMRVVDRRGARERQAVRGGDLLHRRT